MVLYVVVLSSSCVFVVVGIEMSGHSHNLICVFFLLPKCIEMAPFELRIDQNESTRHQEVFRHLPDHREAT